MMGTFLSVPSSTPTLSDLLAPIAAAARRGHYDLLLAEAERAVGQLFPGSSPRILVRVGGVWREWSTLDEGQSEAAAAAVMPDEALTWDDSHRLDDDLLFVPVDVGALGFLIDHRGNAPLPAALEAVRQCVSLAALTCERQRIAAQNLDEVQALQRVATRMLSSRDLGEILLHITQEAKRLLAGDICGVLLKEGDEIVMRRCVGNHSPETAALRMVAGQGLAGRALALRGPAAVEDYVTDAEISRDFFRLAETEMVRSALAVPLVGRDDVIGVLEVWRRRPSTFTALDHVRLVALANLTFIAIQNVELHSAQRRAVDELSQAHAALSQRYDTVRSLSTLTHTLMQALLGGGGLPAIVGEASRFLDADIGLFDLDGGLLAWGGRGDPVAAVADLADANANANANAGAGAEGWRREPLRVESETVGWVCGRLGPRGADMTELTLVQVAMVAALHRLEQRAASRARSETIDAIVWDLLQSDESQRAAAIDRAADIKLDLGGPLRLLVCEIGPLRRPGPDQALSVIRGQVAATIATVKPTGVRAIALHGHSLAIVCADVALDDVERLAQRLAQRLDEALGERQVLVGGSSSCAHARDLGTAWREAQIALDVARQLNRTGAVVYDRAGVVGMLLGLRHEAGMQRFLELNLGRLLLEEERQREQLIETLRIYFDLNGSQEAAAQRLGVHRKTISYRLKRISELTGLDLSTHDDRLVADLSLYIYRLVAGGAGASGGR